LKENEILKSLGDETRLRILNLFTSDRKHLCVCEMVDALKIPQYQVSKHLVILKHAGLLEVERQGTWAYYSFKKEPPQNSLLLNFLKQFCAGGVFEQDRQNLEVRLSVREAGKCVLGFVSEKELLKLHAARTVEPL
jgi:DNA-binding transcriptional ArsR family regulator